LCTFQGHEKPIHTLAFSADGRLLASGGDDQIIRVWDLATQKEVVGLRGHTQPVSSLAFSPDARRLASAGTGRGAEGTPQPVEVKVWDTNSGREILTRHLHWVLARSVVFSPDSRRLACAGGGSQIEGRPPPGELTVWDLTTATEEFRIPAHQAA